MNSPAGAPAQLSGRARTAQAAAVQAARFSVPPAQEVRYESHGALLITGPGSGALAACRRLAAHLSVVVFSPQPEPAQVPPTVRWVCGRIVELSGWMGRFAARSAGPGGQALDAGPFSSNGDGLYDLVLDLDEAPLIGSAVTPPGYYAPRGDAGALEQVLAELPRRTGAFGKPRYFVYRNDLCAHGRQGKDGCDRCLEGCPARAITPREAGVTVEPFLCQGCATCVAACPTGALSYAYPERGASFARLQRALHAYREAGGEGPCLLIHPADLEPAQRKRWAGRSPRLIPYGAKSVISLGLEFWFAALATGVNQVLVLDFDAVPPQAREELARQADLARRILAGIGRSADAVRVVSAGDVQNWSPPAMAPGAAVFNYPPAADKRELLFSVLDHLSAAASVVPEPLALPAGAPFGTIEVEREACTLCMACVGLCPTRALSGSEEDLRLNFTEFRCVQCGLCAGTCPEQAIRLVPRLMYHGAQRATARLLNESDRVRCSSCGKPFMSRKLLESGMARVKDHPMFQGEGLKRLEMCPECRAAAALGRA